MAEFKIPPEVEKLGDDDDSDQRKSQASQLVELCASMELFHSPEDDAFASFKMADHLETWPLKGKHFRQHLCRKFYETRKSAPSAKAIQDALGVLEGQAKFEGKCRKVFTRIGEYAGKVYLDLANDTWEAIEIDEVGFRLIKVPPIRFRRSKGMLPLPVPNGDASAPEVLRLRKFVNIGSDDDFKLIVAWLLGSLSPKGPYPSLIFYGGQGSAKSTTTKAIRGLIDPNVSPLRAEPKVVDDLMIAAKNAWAISFDNMSFLPDWLSDAACRMSTGGGLSKRELFTDDGEVILDAQRPIILNGIDEFVVRGDLLDRAIVLHLPTISEEGRKSESGFWAGYELERPVILGALLQAISTALRELPRVNLTRLPRMADFARWVHAAERSFGWPTGSILTAYRINQLQANDVILESSALTPFLHQLARQGWEGTATQLLSKLNEMRGMDTTLDRRGWPSHPKSLSDKLRRLAPALKRTGIAVDFRRVGGANARRLIVIEGISMEIPASPQSPASQDEGDGRDSCDAEKPVFTPQAPDPFDEGPSYEEDYL